MWFSASNSGIMQSFLGARSSDEKDKRPNPEVERNEVFRVAEKKNYNLIVAKGGKNTRRSRIMANKETKQTSGANKYNRRRWSVPSKRAKAYAEDRKAKVHTYGPKEGKELSEFEAGMRSGYLQAQSDHCGLYKYKKALAEGKSKAEAKEISQTKGKK